ncbi:MAG: CopG family transcriptional regulator [Dehalococcoidia bacterium]|nr:CopG family transcriptional regulator [Dehalococcoidia bacterium]
MVRTQIQLTEEQAKALKEIAAQRGVSTAQMIRESVERIIEERDRKEKWRKALAIMGRYRSGLSDVSANHDKYLAEDYL